MHILFYIVFKVMKHRQTSFALKSAIIELFVKLTIILLISLVNICNQEDKETVVCQIKKINFS